ncbi:hypothetical protein PG994_004897 [Apiospora phragmitis]|uniref:Uncharacterized protein n=1 Tax=Apiospora phragmitis TaxID=2905665 RepID=A0ABR1VVX1_9PEZI
MGTKDPVWPAVPTLDKNIPDLFGTIDGLIDKAGSWFGQRRSVAVAATDGSELDDLPAGGDAQVGAHLLAASPAPAKAGQPNAIKCKFQSTTRSLYTYLPSVQIANYQVCLSGTGFSGTACPWTLSYSSDESLMNTQSLSASVGASQRPEALIAYLTETFGWEGSSPITNGQSVGYS